MTTQSNDLANHFTAILSNPETPTEIYNALVEELTDQFSRARIDFLTPEVLRFAYPLVIAKLKEQGDHPLAASPVSASVDDTPTASVRSASLIADLLESDNTPDIIHTLLDQFCSELSNQLSSGDECGCSPATIRLHMPAQLERAARQRLICPTGGVILQPIDAEPPQARSPVPEGAPSDAEWEAIPDSLIDELAEEAVGGNADAFVMLTIAIDQAINAGQLRAAHHILFSAQKMAYDCSRQVNAFMNYRESTARHLERRIEDRSK
jgi:hypothetical protein